MSAVPGLQLEPEHIEDEGVTTHKLVAETEWRFEVPFSSQIEIKLTIGDAEIFGTEIPIGHAYTFSGYKGAIWTWHGCTIEVKGTPSVDYTSEETPMVPHANAHFALQRLRGQAQEQNSSGPRVLIVGPDDAGKTTLVKLLTSYAQRMGERVTVVNMNPKEGLLSLPGTLTASTFSTILDVEDGWGSSPTTGPSGVPVKLPLVYYLGLENPEQNTKLYKKIVSRMALAVNSRLQEDETCKSSGCIIDTPGSINTTAPYELIQHIVAEFSVNIIISLGSERLYSDLVKKFETERSKSSATEKITVVKLAKSGGVVDRDANYMKEVRHDSVKRYFYGEPKRPLSPYTMTVDFDQLHIYKLPEQDSLNLSFMPVGYEGDLNKPILEKQAITPLLTNALAAILHANLNDSVDDMVISTVMGFVYILEVDEKKKKVKMLVPIMGRLPARPMVTSSFPEVMLNT